MDQSISKLETIINGISFKGISREEWVFTIRHIIDEFRPYLKYLSGFNSIDKGFINKKLGKYELRRTEFPLVYLPSSVNLDTLCVELTHRFLEEGKRRTILLTRKGDLLFWDFSFLKEKIFEPDLGLCRVESATECVFKTLSDKLLLKIFSKDEKIALDIVRGLWSVAANTVKEKRERLSELEFFFHKIDGLVGRIKG